jgi:hypothetical protein
MGRARFVTRSGAIRPACSLLSEKREPEVSNHIYEGSAEKEFRGETDNTEGNDDDENKKDNRTEL